MCSPPETTDEVLDLVDENDTVIGHANRRDIHRLGLRHRAVHILVFDMDDHLLLQKRALHKDINPGLWDTSAAGHVEMGESYDDAARRELLEELDIQSPINAIGQLQAEAETGWEFIKIYRCHHPGQVNPDPNEIIETAWVPIGKINDRVREEDPSLTLSFRRLWAEVQVQSFLEFQP